MFISIMAPQSVQTILKIGLNKQKGDATAHHVWG
jgi:hypothetical protein